MEALWVAPHVGAWIETDMLINLFMSVAVAPHVGAWIETQATAPTYQHFTVAPHVGAWIETDMLINLFMSVASLPMWERGLKLLKPPLKLITSSCRSPCGSVD